MRIAKRLLFVSAPIAAVNLGVMIAWIGSDKDWADPGKLLAQPVMPFLLAYLLAFLITAFGLSLLILLMSPLLSRFLNRVYTIPIFIAAGGLLGWAMFAWAPEPLFFASCGAFSAAMGALFMRDLFVPAPGAVTQDALAD
jgi:hypothetical protein